MAVRYDQETKDRVIRMFEERRQEAPEESRSASYRRLNELTGIPVDTMRGWVDNVRVDAGESRASRRRIARRSRHFARRSRSCGARTRS